MSINEAVSQVLYLNKLEERYVCVCMSVCVCVCVLGGQEEGSLSDNLLE